MIFSRRAALAAGLAATLPAGFPASAQLLARGRAQGLSVGISNERPYAFVDTDGTLKGVITDVLAAACAPLGVTQLRPTILDFDGMIPGLNAGRFDVIGAGMYIRPVRCRAVAFTNPITRAGAGFAARRGNPKNLRSLADVAARADATIGTQTGTAQIEEMRQANIPRERTVLFARVDEALAGLQAGRVDVIYFPAPQIAQLVRQANDPAIERVEGFRQLTGPDGEPAFNYQAYGLRQADADLREALDAQLAAMIGDGRLLRILSQYGFGADDLPGGDVRAARLCAAT